MGLCWLYPGIIDPGIIDVAAIHAARVEVLILKVQEQVATFYVEVTPCWGDLQLIR